MGVINALVACQMCAGQAIIDSAINLIMIVTSVLQQSVLERAVEYIFIIQAMLELPIVARSSHGNYLFDPWAEPSSQNSAQSLLSSHCNLCSPVYF